MLGGGSVDRTVVDDVCVVGVVELDPSPSVQAATAAATTQSTIRRRTGPPHLDSEASEDSRIRHDRCPPSHPPPDCLYSVPMARRSLTPQDFVDAAFDLVNEEGPGALTARGLATRMGVDASALYRHFEHLDALGGAVLDKLFEGVDIDDLGDGTVRERLDRLVDRIHQAFTTRPNLLALALSNSAPARRGERVSRAGLDLLEELGLRGEQLVICAQMIESALFGMHLFDFGGAPHHLSTRRARLRRMDHPAVDAAARTDADVAAINERTFRLAIDALLDRCEDLARANATTG